MTLPLPRRFAFAVILVALATQAARAWEPVSLPAAVRAKLPTGHVARLAACSRTLDPPRPICIVVVARPEESKVAYPRSQAAPPRPLLVYRLARGGATLIARNDRMALHADEGGQCDPVEDGGAIATKGRFFTLESGVACGQHWTDFITFRFDPRARTFVWHNRIRESWRLNDDSKSAAPAMVRDSRSVLRADPRHPVNLDAYAPV